MPPLIPDLDRIRSTIHGLAGGLVTLQKRGVVDLRDPRSVVEMLRIAGTLSPVAAAIAGSAARDATAIILIDELGRCTAGDLDRDARALAAAWAADGLGPDTTIALLCRDHRWHILAMAAAGHLGARLLMCNTGFAAPQLADVLEREGADVLVHDEEFTELVAPAPDSARRVLAWTDADADAIRDGGAVDPDTVAGAIARQLPPPRAPKESGRVIMLTSGTTGTPKGAPRQVRSTPMAMQFLDRVPLRTGARVLILSPMFHGTGLALGTLTLAVGGCIVLHRRFDPEQVARTITEERLTGIVLVPTQLRRLLDLGAEVLDTVDSSALELMVTAGSALPAAVGTRAMERFGEVVHNLYGSTEVAVVAVATPEDWRRSPGTVGRPPRGCRVRLYDGDGERVSGVGVSGRIFVDNGMEFEGYTDGRNKQVIDGFMSSGDTGHVDRHGLLHVDGRDDDMILSGGENVFPIEVEELLVNDDRVAEACVIGVDDEDFGQRLAAYVVPAPGATVTASDVKELVKSQLARHKVPRDVVVLEEIPRNPTGKVLKRELPPAR